MEYRADLFDRETIERMGAHWICLVRDIVQNPESSLAMYCMLSEEEKRQLLEEWNATEREYERGVRVVDLIARAARENADHVAVVSGGKQISYGELERRSNQLGNYLRRKGVGVESRVGVCMERSVEMVVALLGIWKAGAAYVPLDAEYPEKRLRYMIEDAELEYVLSDGSAGEKLGVAGDRVIDLREQWEEIGRNNEEELVESGSGTGNLAYVIYTSGSTGEPKGVMVEHHSLTNVLQAAGERLGLGRADRSLCLAAMVFDISLLEMLGVLVQGGEVEVLRSEEVLDVEGVVKRLEKVSVLHAVPSLMWQIVKESRREGRGKGLRLVMTGGDLVNAELLEEMKEVFRGARV
jgi:non-ribosomal peptide synthetase component F